MKIANAQIIQEYHDFLSRKDFPCVAAKASLALNNVKCMVAGNMECPGNDADILQFFYDFVDEYSNSKELYHSVAIIFTGRPCFCEIQFQH